AELAEQPGLRALVLAAAPRAPLRYAVVGASGARLGDPAGHDDALDGVVADLASARGAAAVAALSTRAVRFVAVRGSSPSLVAALDAQAGLVRRGDEPLPLWQVSAPTSRLQLLPPAAAAAARRGADGPDAEVLRSAAPVAVRGTVPAGAAGRLLVLAEPAGDGWTATVAGRPLPRATAWGWAQGFVLPRTGGAVRVAHDAGSRGPLLALQALLVLAATVVAGPGSGRSDP
ncbi:MAG: family 2 glycosyl transferase, partial [Frankiales bacterium]|nr:family 2 glycosyl transferase [Frankiales bacterium]